MGNISGVFPDSLAFDPDNHLLYAGGEVGEIGVVDTATNSLEGPIQVNSTVGVVAYDHFNRELYASAACGAPNLPYACVVVINTTTDHIVASINLSSPDALAVDTRTGNVLVLNNSWVVVLDPRTNSILRSLDVNQGSNYLYDLKAGATYVPPCSCFFVGDPGWGMDVIGYNATDGSPYLEFHLVNQRGLAPTYDPVNGLVYVTSANNNNVSVIDPTSDALVATIAAGNLPVSSVVDTLKGLVYVANWDYPPPTHLSGLTVINGSTNTIVTHISIDGVAPGLAFDSANGDIYVGASSTGPTPPGGHIAVVSPYLSQSPPPGPWEFLGLSQVEWLGVVATAAVVAFVFVAVRPRMRIRKSVAQGVVEHSKD